MTSSTDHTEAKLATTPEAPAPRSMTVREIIDMLPANIGDSVTEAAEQMEDKDDADLVRMAFWAALEIALKQLDGVTIAVHDEDSA